MGLLDALQGFGNNPAAVQGLLATGLGMLAANRGGVTTGQAIGQGGLLGMNAYANAQAAQQKAAQDAAQQKMWEQQISASQTEEQMKQAQLAMQLKQQQGLDNLAAALSGQPVPADASADPSSVPPMLSGPAADATSAATAGANGMAGISGGGVATMPVAGGVGGAAPGAPQAPSKWVQLANMLPESQKAAALADIQLNQGKNLPNFFKPDVVIENGIVYDKNSNKVVGTVPTQQNGVWTLPQVDAKGNVTITLPQGGNAALQQSEETKANVASAHAMREVEDRSTGEKRLATEAEIMANPNLRLTGRSPEVAQAMQLGNTDFMTNSYRPALAAGTGAQADLDQITAMRQIDPATGWGAEAAGKAATILGALGVDKAEKYASSQQQFNNVAMTKLNQNLAEQKGPQTEGDAQRASKTFASLANTPEANSFILDYAQAQAELKQRRAAFYQEALPLAQRSGDLAEIDRRWRKIQGSIWDNPVMAKWSQQKEGSAAPADTRPLPPSGVPR